MEVIVDNNIFKFYKHSKHVYCNEFKLNSDSTIENSELPKELSKLLKYNQIFIGGLLDCITTSISCEVELQYSHIIIDSKTMTLTIGNVVEQIPISNRVASSLRDWTSILWKKK